MSNYFCIINEGVQTLTPQHLGAITSHGSSAIKIANLHMNHLQSLDSVVAVLGNRLEDLDVSSNILHSLSGLHFVNLTRLNVSSNLLRNLHGLTVGAPNLVTLLACYNRIDDVTGLALHTRLGTLSLLCNALSDTSQIRVLSTIVTLRNLQLCRGDGSHSNPVTSMPGYRSLVKGMIPDLTSLDEQWFGNPARNNNNEDEKCDEDYSDHYSDTVSEGMYSTYSTATPLNMSEVSLDEEFLRHIESLKQSRQHSTQQQPIPTAPQLPSAVVSLTTRSMQTKPEPRPKSIRCRDSSTNTKDIVTPMRNLCSSQLIVIERLKEQMEAVERERDEAASEAKALRETLRISKETAARSTTESAQMRDDMIHLRTHRDTLQTDLCIVERSLAQTTGQFQQATLMCQQLQRELDARISAADLKEREKENEQVVTVSREKELLAKLSVVVKEQRDALVASQGTIRKSQEDLSLQALELQKWKSQCSELQAALKTTKEESVCRDPSPHCSVREHSEAILEKGKLQGALVAATVANEAMQSELEQCHAHLTASKEDVERLKHEVESQHRALHNLTNTIREKDAEIDDLVAEGRHWREHSETKSSELRATKEKLEQLPVLQDQVGRCKSRLEDMNRECVRLRDVVVALRKEMSDTATAHCSAMEAAKTQETSLRAEVALWQKVSKDMEGKLNEQKAGVLALLGK